MKPCFKFYILKILLLFLLHTTIQSAEVAVALAAEELAVLTGVGIGIIGQALNQYKQARNGETLILQVTLPNVEGTPSQNISTMGKSEKEVMAAVTHAAAVLIGTKYNLSIANQSELPVQNFVDRRREQTKRDYVEHYAQDVQDSYQNSYVTPCLEDILEVRREAEERFELEFSEEEHCEFELSEDASLKIEDDLVTEEPISLAPAVDQPIAEIAPPPLPPEGEPDTEDKQEQDSPPSPPEGKNKIKKSQGNHNWGDRSGHLVKNPENEKLIYDMANDSERYLGQDTERGHHWYGKILKDGKQAWAKVRNNEIVSWGVNKANMVRPWNSKTGLAAVKAPSQTTPGEL